MSYEYYLYGVVCHSGTLKGGHYIAYVNHSLLHSEVKPDGWYYHSDSYFKPVNFDEVQKSEAFMLFYERGG